MFFDSLLAWIEGTPVAEFMQLSAWGFPAAESVHVIAIALVVGLIAVVDLRLIGVASRSRAVAHVMRDGLRYTWLAFAAAVISGLLLFATNASDYFYNTPFRLKMLMLLLAGINMLVFELFTVRGLARWEAEGRIPPAARLAGLLSLGLWIAVIAFGRWVGFSVAASQVPSFL